MVDPDPGIAKRNREPGIHCDGFLFCDFEPPINNRRSLPGRVLICPPADSKQCIPAPVNSTPDPLNPGCFVIHGTIFGTPK